MMSTSKNELELRKRRPVISLSVDSVCEAEKESFLDFGDVVKKSNDSNGDEVLKSHEGAVEKTRVTLTTEYDRHSSSSGRVFVHPMHHVIIALLRCSAAHTQH